MFQELLAHRLKHRFKNWRKRSISPSVNHRGTKKMKQAPDMPGYQPTVTNNAIEDQKAINMMKSPDVGDDSVKQLMNTTYPVRRRDVIKGTSVAKLKKLFPRLFTVEQVGRGLAIVFCSAH